MSRACGPVPAAWATKSLTSDALITSARRRALELLQRSPDRHGELAEALLHEGPTLPGLRIVEILGSPR